MEDGSLCLITVEHDGDATIGSATVRLRRISASGTVAGFDEFTPLAQAAERITVRLPGRLVRKSGRSECGRGLLECAVSRHVRAFTGLTGNVPGNGDRGTVSALVAGHPEGGYAVMEMEIAGDERETPRERRRWSRIDYLRIVAAGVLGEDEDVELVAGEILVKKRESARHAAAIGRVQRALEQAFGPTCWVRIDRPFALDQESMPDPDLAVVPGSPDDYENDHPQQAALLVEVSDTSRGFDLGAKQRMYSRAAQPEFWCVDLAEELLWVHRDPGPKGYRSILRLERGREVAPLQASAQIAVASLLPRLP